MKKRLITKSGEILSEERKGHASNHKVRRAYIYYELAAKLYLRMIDLQSCRIQHWQLYKMNI